MKAFYAVACACALSSVVEGIRINAVTSNGWLQGQKTTSSSNILKIRGGAG